MSEVYLAWFVLFLVWLFVVTPILGAFIGVMDNDIDNVLWTGIKFQLFMALSLSAITFVLWVIGWCLVTIKGV